MTARGGAGPDLAAVNARRDALYAAILQAHRGVRAPLVMGILNTTPDSFSDGGAHPDAVTAGASIEAMLGDGATLIDVGGESTRPGAARVDAATECGRVLPVIQAAARQGVTVSCDTYKAEVACKALEAGAVMVNDVGGLQADAGMAQVVANSGALIGIMHGFGLPVLADADMAQVLRDFFAQAIAGAEANGIARDRIVLDPGIGFSKTDAQNIACFELIPALRAEFDLPILIGVSRKSMLGRMLGRDVGERLAGSLAAAVVAAQHGAAIMRVHDVAAHVDALKIAHLLGRDR